MIPGSVSFTESDKKDLLEYDTTGFEFFSFKDTSPKAKVLQEGTIIFIHGTALRRVYEVVKQNGKITVSTERVRLNEAVSNALIAWNKPMRFTKDLIPQMQVHSKYPVTQKINGDEFELEFPLGNSLKGKIKMTMGDDRLDAACEVSKKVGIAAVKYAFEGYVQKIQSQGGIRIQESSLKQFQYNNKGVEGEVTVSLVATGSTADLLGAIELPFVIFKIPVALTPVPIFVNLKVMFVINTQLASIDASAFAKAKFKFNSETGVQYDGHEIGIMGAAGPFNIDTHKDSCWVGSSTAAGINFGLTFPRFELGILGEILVPYIHTAFLIGGSYTFGTKSCLTVDASFIGAVGYDFDFLGLLKSSGSKKLWQQDKNIKKSGQCD
jgi:hypothetical protein